MQVDYNAKTEYDAVNNYKVLQAAFLKLGVDKVKASAPQQTFASHTEAGCKANIMTQSLIDITSAPFLHGCYLGPISTGATHLLDFHLRLGSTRVVSIWI